MRSRWWIYHLKAHSKWDLMNRKKLYLIKMTANYDHVRKVLLIAKNTLIDFNWLFASTTPQSDYFGYFASFQRCFSLMSAKSSEIQNLYFSLCLVPPSDREKSKSEFRILIDVNKFRFEWAFKKYIIHHKQFHTLSCDPLRKGYEPPCIAVDIIAHS